MRSPAHFAPGFLAPLSLTDIDWGADGGSLENYTDNHGHKWDVVSAPGAVWPIRQDASTLTAASSSETYAFGADMGVVEMGFKTNFHNPIVGAGTAQGGLAVRINPATQTFAGFYLHRKGTSMNVKLLAIWAGLKSSGTLDLGEFFDSADAISESTWVLSIQNTTEGVSCQAGRSTTGSVKSAFLPLDPTNVPQTTIGGIYCGKSPSTPNEFDNAREAVV
jgi:hypothetical protein